MKSVALVVALLVGCSTASELSGTHSFCASGKRHVLQYKVKEAVGDTMTDLDGIGSELKQINCDISGSRLEIVFHDEIHSTALWGKIKLGGAYLLGGKKHGCPIPTANVSAGFTMRKVFKAQLNGQAVIVNTLPATYDEIYEDADITYGASQDAECVGASINELGCVGVNANPTCDQAAAALPIYSNDIVSVTCDNCFAGLAFDVFFDLKLESFQLKKLKAGFGNITINAALDVNMDAQKAWSVGVDKDMHIAGGQSNPVISFKIGSVPFVFWFDASQRLTGDAQMQASATAQAGVQMAYDIGDFYIKWDEDEHWTHEDPSPSVKFTPSVSGHAGFSGSASLSLVPQLSLHVNQLFSYGVTLDPLVSMQVEGDTDKQQICETASYDVKLTTDAQLHLNIPFANIHDDREWGPTTIWESKGTLSQACVQASGKALV